MNFFECCIKVKSEEVDFACADLLDFNLEGLEIIDPNFNNDFLQKEASWDYNTLEFKTDEQATIKFYLPADSVDSKNTLKSLENAGFLVEIKEIDDSFLNSWKLHYKPLEIGENLLILPEWEEYDNQANKTIIKLNPGHAFGTGQHESTALCLKMLENAIKVGDSVLDIGCGSGILGITAAKLGASSVLAQDIDEAAIKITKENAHLNGVSNLEAQLTTPNAQIKGKYNLILANIVASVIISLLPNIRDILADNGVFIAGGIIDEKEQEVLDALLASGFKITKIERENGWVAILCTGFS